MNKAKKLFELYLVNIHKEFENPNLVPNINDRGQLNWIFQNIITKPFDEILDKAKYLKPDIKKVLSKNTIKIINDNIDLSLLEFYKYEIVYL